jgi:aminoglycoside phosphotransferase (APT) family kinase protein
MLNQIAGYFNIQIKATQEVDDSHSSTVFKCFLHSEEIVFVKIPFTKLKFQRELEAYNLLKGRVPTPRLLDFWSGNDTIPCALLLSELKGEPLTKNAPSSTAYEVGVLQASMHSIPPANNLKALQNEFPDWSRFVAKQFYSFAEDVKGLLDEKLYQKAIERFEKMKKELPLPDGPSFLHMDFRPANILIEENQVSGVLDFESVRFGSTEIDFTKLYRDYLQYNPSSYEAFKAGYRSVRPLIDLEAVLPFYQFTDAFNSIGWCKRRGIEENKLFFEENVARLTSFLSS